MTPQQILNSERGLHEHNRQKHPNCKSCKRVFENQNNLNAHFRSSIHKPANLYCVGKDCKRSFITEAALVLHCESGSCSSGVNRQNINPTGFLCDSPSSERGAVWPTLRCWNGDAYECILCHHEFRTLPALDSHLQSLVHEQSMCRCPPRQGGCNQEFRTWSGLFQHVESECCGVRRLQGEASLAL